MLKKKNCKYSLFLAINTYPFNNNNKYDPTGLVDIRVIFKNKYESRCLMPNKKSKKIFSITQQNKPDYWEWYEAEKNVLGDLNAHADLIRQKLVQNGIDLEEMYAIYHDKDKTVVYDKFDKELVEKLKEPHIHVLFKAKESQDVETVANAVGVAPEYIEYAKKGSQSYNNMLAYLIHAKDKQKHQYSPNEVLTLVGVDYKTHFANLSNQWKIGAIKKTANQKIHNLSGNQLESVIDKILTQEISRDEILTVPEYKKAYVYNQQKIDRAFERVAEDKYKNFEKNITARNIEKLSIYIYGETGTGKTKFAKELAERIRNFIYVYTGETWNSVSLASKNPFDDYNGEEIIILDDFRENTLEFKECLKVFGPNEVAPAAARYKNKKIYFHVAIITTTKRPERLFKKAKEDELENIRQFERRMGLMINAMFLTDDDLDLYNLVDLDDYVEKKYIPKENFIDEILKKLAKAQKINKKKKI